MKYYILILLLFIGFIANAQTKPSGVPTQFNLGWQKWAWSQSDSGLIVAKRDTNFLPRFSGTVVFRPTDRRFYYYDSTDLRWYLLMVDTTSLSNRINLKLNISDTTSMLLPYLRKADTTNKWINNIRRLPGSLNVEIFKNGAWTTAYTDSIGTGGGGSGTVTSVALSMPSAFSVTGSPITTSGTFSISGAGSSLQYIRGNGTLATTDTSMIPAFYLKVRSLLSGTSPITYNSTTGAFGITNANTSGTKGASTFSSSDFSDNGSGLISLKDVTTAGSCIGCVISYDAKGRIITATSGGGGSGIIDTAINIGSGVGLFKNTTTDTLNFKSLTEGYGINFTNNTNDINIEVDTSSANGLATQYDLTQIKTIYNSNGVLLSDRHISGGANGFAFQLDSSSSISLFSGLEFISSGIGSSIQMSDSVMNIGSSSATDFTSITFSPTRIKFLPADGAGSVGDVWTNTGSGFGHWAPASGGSSSVTGDTIIYMSRSAGIISDADISAGSTTFGTDNTTAAQAVLDIASHTQGVYLVWDVRISHTGLRIGPNTFIQALPSYGAILRNNSDKPLFRNRDTAFGREPVDSNITVQGGIWNGNSYNSGLNPAQAVGTPSNGTTAVFSFYGVRNLIVRDFVILRQRTYAIAGNNLKNALYENGVIDGGDGGIFSDGVHFDGNSEHCTARNLKIHAIDDAVGLNADDAYDNPSSPVYGYFPASAAGPISDIQIENIFLDDGQFGVRILSGSSRVDNIRVKNITGNTIGYAFIMDNFWQDTSLIINSGVGNVGEIQLENIDVNITGIPAILAQSQMILLRCNAEKVLIKDIKRYGYGYPGLPTVRISGAYTNINSVVIDGYDAKDTSSTQIEHILIEDATVNSLTVQRANVQRINQGDGLIGSNNATINKMQINNILIDSLNYVYFNSSSTINNINITNVRHTSNAFGTYGTVHNSGGTISNIVFSNYSGGSATNGAFGSKLGDAFPASATQPGYVTIGTQDIQGDKNILARTTFVGAIHVPMPVESSFIDAYTSASSNDAILLRNSSGGATVGVQNSNAAGFSGIEYLSEAGVSKVFSGLNNANGQEFRFNNFTSGGYIRFLTGGNEKMQVNNTGGISLSQLSAPISTYNVLVHGLTDSVVYQVPASLFTGISTLNSLTAATQTFATGTSGTDFNISSATSTHTFNIPSASTSNRGLVTTSSQTFGGTKTFNDGIVVTSSSLTPRVTISGSYTAGSAPGVGGVSLGIPAFTYTNTAGAGTETQGQNFSFIGTPTLTSSNAISYTGEVATFRVAGAPIAAGSTTIDHPYAIYANDVNFLAALAMGVNEQSGDATLGNGSIVVYTGAGGNTFTLPSLATHLGKTYFIKNIGSGSVTVARSGSDNLYTSSSVTSTSLTAGSAIIVSATSSFWIVQ